MITTSPPTPRLTPEQQQLVAANVALVHYLTRQLRTRLPALRRVPYADLVGAGHVGLCQAALHFRPALGWRFTTYAGAAIRQHVLRAADHDHLVAVPEHISRALRGRPGDKPASAEALDAGRRAARPPRSLAPRPGDGADLFDPATEDDHERLAFEDATAGLSSRYRRVLRLLFIDGLTLRAASAELGVSCERVRQLREDALARLRRLHSCASAS